METRRIANTDLYVTPLALGCWPITGMTTLDANQADSLDTIAAALDAGLNFLDTAFCYGADGSSETMIRQAVGDRRDEVVIATKGGIHWDENLLRVLDASPGRLRWECEQSLQRLGTDRVDLLYLHAPDPNVPVAESAGALRQLLEEGKTRAVGASNMSVEQLDEFQAVCPLAAVQPHYNLLQREIEDDVIPWCQRHGVSVIVYWPLMKGLLAGRLQRDHQFDPRDGRAKYPMFQGDEWQKNQDFVDELRALASDTGKSVSQIVLNWTIHRPGITAALCGAKRRGQIEENAGALLWQLTSEQLARIDAALVRRGPIATRSAV